MSDKNIDSLLMKVQGSPGNPPEAESVPVEPETKDQESTQDDEYEKPMETIPSLDQEAKEESSEPNALSPDAEDQKEEDKEEEKLIDEYGNPTEKQKMYTEEEVQRMIRDRLSRGKHPEPTTNKQVNDAAKDFTPDPNSEDSWEEQLNSFVDKRLDQREKMQSERQWKQEEEQKQSEFESKFNLGMGKYKDFHNVVSGKPITDAMMLAARSFKDPAGFIYAASKLQPKELERIATIKDPYIQAAEVGKLEANMRKTRNAKSNTPKPLPQVKGDIPDRTNQRPSIDIRIAQDAKRKFNRK